MASSSSHHAASLPSKKYPYPAAEVNLRDFVPIILSNENYFVWKTLMLRLIESQGMVGFINGEVSPPERNITKEIENQDYYEWKRSDALMQRWIIGTINENVLRDVVCLETAKDIWERLITLHERKIEYPYPVWVTVEYFVPVKLSRENYSLWAKLMFHFIERQGLVGFINGEVLAPEESFIDGTSGEYKAWKRTDDLLQMWIMKTIINEDVRACVVDLKTAHDVWIKLEKDLTQIVIIIEDEGNDRSMLHRATLRSDWEAAKECLKKNSDLIGVDITGQGDTMLSLAVMSKQRNHFVKNILELMSSPLDVIAVNHQGQTSLHIAAAAGNLEAAKWLVEKNQILPNIPDYGGEVPLQRAALFGHRNLAHYLLAFTEREYIGGEHGGWFVRVLIGCGLYDIALLFVECYPELAMENQVDLSLLQTIAMENSAFPSGSKFC
ncbi:uncharacterized protein LOC132311533 isoform X2 [Cornus florida]|uniref:uncharacterized protein LOC132311533 isoform X2 n=1 Tax=Cornus florida TaxID=4283 RepID=UPI002897E235|nr:uncharacterized protein LOC132311533 isoform X2 [Cornus florida]